MQSGFPYGKMERIALQAAFSLFPGGAAKKVIAACYIEQIPEGAFGFFFSDDGCAGADINR